MLHSSVIVYSTPEYIQRLSPFICPCPVCPCVTCLQPCEQPKEYCILYCDDDWTNMGQVHFEIKELSTFTQRQPIYSSYKRCLCPPSRRPLVLIDKHQFSEVHIRVEKPFKCSFLCFQRPEMLIYLRDQYIGKVVEEWQWALVKCTFYNVLLHSRKLTCYDKNNALLFRIEAPCCQCSLFCMLPCQSCSEIEFHIRDRQKNVVGRICHLFGGFRREWCSKADTFGINFPEFSTVEEKTILIMASIFIDYAQFQNF